MQGFAKRAKVNKDKFHEALDEIKADKDLAMRRTFHSSAVYSLERERRRADKLQRRNAKLHDKGKRELDRTDNP